MDLCDGVFLLVSFIPAGQVSSYGVLADALDCSPRVVGRVLGLNDNPVVVPCHRVVHSDGWLGGFRWGVSLKSKLLLLEGVDIEDNRVLDFDKLLYTDFI